MTLGGNVVREGMVYKQKSDNVLYVKVLDVCQGYVVFYRTYPELPSFRVDILNEVDFDDRFAISDNW